MSAVRGLLYPLLAAVTLAALLPAAGEAGGALQIPDLTDELPSPKSGQVAAPLVNLRWDERCIPVQLTLNAGQTPLNNPLGADFLTVQDAAQAIERALDSWRRIPTSFIDFSLDVGGPPTGPPGFDTVHEISFSPPPGAPYIAISIAEALGRDSYLEHGDDLDGDGDSDVVAGLATCADADNDGDIEMPEGFYKAGTLLDNDIIFNTDLFRFTTQDDQLDTEIFSIDLQGLATHELGHGHGLSHSSINQIGPTRGDGATMFIFPDPSDPDDQLAWRSLSLDDITYSSFFYPEGSAYYGPAALQYGDFPYHLIFGTLEGEILDSQGNGVTGTTVFATNPFSDRVMVAAYAGEAQASVDLITGAFDLVDKDFHLLSGRYRMPAPFGLYTVGMEATDGFPVRGLAVNDTTVLAEIFGVQTFNEEFFNGYWESAVESRPGDASLVLALPHRATRGLDLVVNDDRTLKVFGSLDRFGLTDATAGTYYAVAFPAAELLAADEGGGLAIQTGLFFTSVFDSSVAPTFEEALLTRCQMQGPTATVDLAHPLRRTSPFFGTETDFTPFYFRSPKSLGRQVLREIQRGQLDSLCLVLRVPPGPYPGVSALPPLIGLDGRPDLVPNDVPLAGRSFLSTDGVSFEVFEESNFMFGLVVTPF